MAIYGIAPCSAVEAIARMRSLVGIDMPYRLGSGDYNPRMGVGGVIDQPWTKDPEGVVGSDCWGAAGAYAYKLKRHRPGFNRNIAGKPRDPRADRDAPTVVDDMNTNSAIEDSEYAQEIYIPVPVGDPVEPGDLLCYPTIQLRGENGDWLRDEHGKPKKWIGHVMMAIDPQGAKSGGPYEMCIVAQCCGGEDRKPAVIITHAGHLDEHDKTWPKFEHRTKVIRVRPDIVVV